MKKDMLGNDTANGFREIGNTPHAPDPDRTPATQRRGRLLSALLNIAIVISCFYLVYCCTLFFLQRRIMYPRYLIPQPTDTEKGRAGIETMRLDTPEGPVEAWYLPPAGGDPGAPAPAVIFAHGNAELIDFWPQTLDQFTRMGLRLLLVEYPGYGRSRGTPDQNSITDTFIAAYDALAARPDVDASRIVLLGRSLGGGAVCALAAKRPSAALILMSTFTSARSFARRFLAPGFLVRDTFDNLPVVSSYNGPILIIHGSRDTIVPYRHGISLYRAAKDATMITYECNHNDCPPDWDIFWRDVSSFLHGCGII
ncbi:MAG: alpha/beta hydrolase [bacterium]